MNKENYIDTNGRIHVTTKVLSSGGQGVVYRTEEPNVLLKLEWNAQTQEIIKDSSNNDKYNDIRLLPLLDNTQITLPLSVLRDVSGYTMILLDEMESFESAFSEPKSNLPNNEWLETMNKADENLGIFFKNYIATGGMKKRIRAYMEAACILAKIHNSGLVYCDVSDKNMFVSSNADKFQVWLIDCDNLDYMSVTSKNGGWRTPGFGAPEVVKGYGNTMYSDAYSFAISLFWTLVTKHPFMGKAVEDALENEDFLDISEEDFACSCGLPWIGDSEDESNTSEDGISYNYFIDEELYSYFQRTFSKNGQENRQKRTTMPEWSYILSKKADSIVRCKCCQMDYWATKNNICPWCDTENKRIWVESYEILGDSKRNKWSFVTEYDNGIIDVPLRLLEGFNSDSLNDNAFRIKISGKSVELTEFNSTYDFYVLSGGLKKAAYGSAIVNDIKSLILNAENGVNEYEININLEV